MGAVYQLLVNEFLSFVEQGRQTKRLLKGFHLLKEDAKTTSENLRVHFGP